MLKKQFINWLTALQIVITLLGSISIIQFYTNEILIFYIALLLSCFSIYLTRLSLLNSHLYGFKLGINVVFTIAFYLKFYVVSYVVFSDSFYQTLLISHRVRHLFTIENLLNAYIYALSAMIIFSVVTIFLDQKFKASSDNINYIEIDRPYVFYLLLLIISVTTIVLRIVVDDPGILPFVYVLNFNFVPILFICSIFIFLYSNNFILSKLTVVVFLLLGVVQFYFFTSKMFILIPIFTLLVLQSVTERKIIDFKKLFFLFSFLIFLYPLFNIFREVSMAGGEVNILTKAVEVFLDGKESMWLISFFSILHRFVGIDSLTVLLSLNDGIYSNFDVLGRLFEENSVTHILTYEVYSFDFQMGVAPTLFGQVAYLSGSMGVFSLFIFFISFCCYLGLSIISQSQKITHKSLYVYMVVYLLLYFNEGVTVMTLKYQLFAICCFYITSSAFMTKKVSK